MDRFETDCVVIGAGVIGLAVARALAISGRDVVVLEAEQQIATHTSSRNSEVIHAGLYYPTGSLKARHCVRGRRLLYAYLNERNIAFSRCGKLVVARSDETDALIDLADRARANGVEDINLISGAEARAMEPALHPDVSLALHSAQSGIFDSHAFFLALQGDLEDAGGVVALETPVVGGAIKGEGVELETGGAKAARLLARTVINAAGHNAVHIARQIDGLPPGRFPKPRFVKGSYFSVSGQTPFSRLIYPMPGRASLGLHLTIDLAGRGKLGPDAEWLSEEVTPPFDYRVDPNRAELFYQAARRYWPSLPNGALSPDYAGVRPKLVGPGEPSGDFRIEDTGAGLINLFGIESPGLTASLSIAEHVAEMLD
ncbi:MAG: NAD(P)/FAD-dependent oxidoreductase [Henriciella sp.]|nr:NAD(P)/FAD-dependent oxidoreductase [Henriciella sp.]